MIKTKNDAVNLFDKLYYMFPEMEAYQALAFVTEIVLPLANRSGDVKLKQFIRDVFQPVIVIEKEEQEKEKELWRFSVYLDSMKNDRLQWQKAHDLEEMDEAIIVKHFLPNNFDTEEEMRKFISACFEDLYTFMTMHPKRSLSKDGMIELAPLNEKNPDSLDIGNEKLTTIYKIVGAAVGGWNAEKTLYVQSCTARDAIDAYGKEEKTDG